MYRLLILCSILALSGCASVFEAPFKPEFDRGQSVKIKYVYVDHEWELMTLCRKNSEDYQGRKLLGCADIPFTPDGVCVVTLYKGFPDVKEHEEKHCRYGRWHQ
jgi:uncharacterized protein YceK